MSLKWDVDGGTKETVPRGKIVPIGSDELEVWPKHCVNGYHCIQCYFIGKTGCAPRFWGPPTKLAQTPGGSKAPVELHEVVFSLNKALPFGKGTLSDYLAAQPVEALNDGGFTEEITERIKNRAVFRTLEPYRITDEPCKCGYQYPLPWGTREGKQKYFCPRCKRYWISCPYGIPPGMRDFVRKLRREELSLKAIQQQVEEVYYRKICRRTIWSWTKGENKELERRKQAREEARETCKCGYQYSSFEGTRGGKQRYFCPRCKKRWTGKRSLSFAGDHQRDKVLSESDIEL